MMTNVALLSRSLATSTDGRSREQLPAPPEIDTMVVSNESEAKY